MPRDDNAAQRLLAIIPARAGSKGLVGKNLRALDGQPLIGHTLDAVSAAAVADSIVVSTDSPRIGSWCRLRGCEVLERPEALAADSTPIAAVAAHVADVLDWHGVVGVFQPTSPLRTARSIRAAWEHFLSSGAESLMSVAPEPHLCWYAPDGDPAHASPLFEERVNRQYAAPCVFRETGAIQFITAEALRRGGGMVSGHHTLFPLRVEESGDIDTADDFEAIRRQIERSMVIFRLTANRAVGSGHLHHCLLLAEELAEQELRFVLVECDDFARELIASRGYRLVEETDLAADLSTLSPAQGSVLVNDVLNTTVTEVLVAKAHGLGVVNIEDLGPGAAHADWVVNALYPPPPVGHHHHIDHGSRWATLRSEFQGLPSPLVREDPERVLLTFGGTDPSRLSERVARILRSSLPETVGLRVILGPGATPQQFPPGVDVLRDVTNMAAEMFAADVVVTSAGRTVYEAAAVGTPVVVVAQSAREATHAHLGYDQGVVFLGIGNLVDDDHIRATVSRLLASRELRAELSDRLRSSLDGDGVRRIAERIRDMIREGRLHR